MSQRPSQPPSPDHTPEYPATTSTVVFLVATALVVLTQLYLAIPLIAPVGRGLGGDATLALSTAFSLCYASGFLIWGPISDRYGRKKILLCGMTLLILTTACCAMAPNLPTLGVLRGLQGFSAASFAPSPWPTLPRRYRSPAAPRRSGPCPPRSWWPALSVRYLPLRSISHSPRGGRFSSAARFSLFCVFCHSSRRGAWWRFPTPPRPAA